MPWTRTGRAPGELAHHVDIVHAAVDDRRQALHQLPVHRPGRARSTAGSGSSASPAACPGRGRSRPASARRGARAGCSRAPACGRWRRALATTASASATVVASGFSRNTWQPASMARMRVGRVGVGIGVDRDRVGPGLAQGLARSPRTAGSRAARAAASPAVARMLRLIRPDDLEAVEPVIGQGMAPPHIADADDEDADRGLHRRSASQRAAGLPAIRARRDGRR